ncbi:MAG TPA: hypothetical protein PK639_04615 [Candidatus Woesebacteria bacterium]|nr:hypothetical protein [Candidatus Woesebacteria bacterium]
MRKIGLILLGLMFLVSKTPAEAYLGTINSGVEVSKVDSKYHFKLIMETGDYRVSLAKMVVNFSNKLKVESVKVNREAFSGVFREEASGENASIYALANAAYDKLPKGKIVVAEIVASAVSTEGTATVSLKEYEVVGPSETSDKKYQIAFENKNIDMEPASVPTPNGTTGFLRFKVSAAGMNANAKCANQLPVSVMVMDNNGVSKTYNEVVLQRKEADGKVNFEGSVLLEGMSSKNSLGVFIKGPKHIQVKYGENNQKEFYNKAGGQVSVGVSENDSPMYDFTGFALMAGDVTGENGRQDGLIDGRDFSLVKSEVVKRTKVAEGGYLAADLNGNCILESQDLALLMVSLMQKQEQLY